MARGQLDTEFYYKHYCAVLTNHITLFESQN